MDEQSRTPVVEQHSFDYIPTTERTGTVGTQVRFWFMVNATLLTAFTGALGPSLGMGLPATLIAIVTGSIFGTLFQAFHGAQGPHMGLPQMIQSRVQFGSRGAAVPTVIAALIPIGFVIFNFQSGASAYVSLVGGGVTFPTIVIAVAAAVLCIFGYRYIVKAESALAWITVANLILLTVAAIAVLPLESMMGNWAVTPFAFLAQFGVSAGYQLAIATMVSDFTRYMPARTPGWRVSAAVFAGTISSAIWIEALGAAVSDSFPKLDVIGALNKMGNQFGFSLGTITMIIGIVVFLTVSSVALYSGSISLLSALEAFRRLRATARLRTVTICIASAFVLTAALVLPANILASFSVFLTFLGYLLIPWTAVNLVDYYIIRRGLYSISDIVRSDGGIYGRWGTRGLISYACGLVAMIPFLSSSIYTGPIASAMGGADISFIFGLSVSGFAYWLLMRRVDLRAEREIISTASIHTGELLRDVEPLVDGNR